MLSILIVTSNLSLNVNAMLSHIKQTIHVVGIDLDVLSKEVYCRQVVRVQLTGG